MTEPGNRTSRSSGGSKSGVFGQGSSSLSKMRIPTEEDIMTMESTLLGAYVGKDDQSAACSFRDQAMSGEGDEGTVKLRKVLGFPDDACSKGPGSWKPTDEETKMIFKRCQAVVQACHDSVRPPSGRGGTK